MDLSFTSEVDEIINSEIGNDAILITATPAETKSIRVVFHTQFSVGGDYDVETPIYEHWADCKTSDVSNAVKNDSLTVGGVAYNIEYPEVQDGSWTILRLSVPN